MKTDIEKLEEIIIRLNQSTRDGKILVGTKTMEHCLKLIVNILKTR